MRKQFQWIRLFSAVCALFFSLTLIGICECIQYLYVLDKHALEIDNGVLYISLQHDSNPLLLDNNPYILESFEDIYEDLQSVGAEYYVLYRQPLYIIATEKIPSDYSQINCIQVSENVYSEFNLSMKSGRWFTENDFFYEENEFIPVLLGGSFMNQYQEGDVFTAEYLYKQFDFVVTGILNEDCKVEVSTGSITLDDYIIMPSFTFVNMPQSDDEYITYKIHSANKTSGIIETTEELFQDTYASINHIISSSDVGLYSLSCSSIEKSLLMNGINLKILNVILIIFGITLWLLAMWIILRERKCKFTPIVFLVFTDLIVSEIVLFMLSYLFGIIYPIKMIPIIGAIIFLIVTYIPTKRFLFRSDINRDIIY